MNALLVVEPQVSLSFWGAEDGNTSQMLPAMNRTIPFQSQIGKLSVFLGVDRCSPAYGKHAAGL